MTNASTLPPLTTVTLGANTWTEMEPAPNFTLRRGGTIVDATLVRTQHAGIYYLVTIMAQRDTASAAITTSFQPLLKSDALAG